MANCGKERCPEGQCCNTKDLCGTGFDYCDPSNIKSANETGTDIEIYYNRYSDSKAIDNYYKNVVTENTNNNESCGPKLDNKGKTIYTRCKTGECCNKNYKCSRDCEINNLNSNSFYQSYYNKNRYNYNGDSISITDNNGKKAISTIGTYIGIGIGAFVGFIVLIIIIYNFRSMLKGARNVIRKNT